MYVEVIQVFLFAYIFKSSVQSIIKWSTFLNIMNYIRQIIILQTHCRTDIFIVFETFTFPKKMYIDSLGICIVGESKQG